jgi:predicted lipoprotein with Yx(FWY)xxD motif
MKLAQLTIPIAAIAVGLAGCGGGGNSGAATAGSGGYGSAQPAGGASSGATVVSEKASKLGKILVDPGGKTLYLFEADRRTASACAGTCATVWPPVTTSGKPKVGAGLAGAQLGTIKRKDGLRQVTFNGHPLYRYVSDMKPGDTTGQGLDQFGAAWYVLTPAGNKIDNG